MSMMQYTEIMLWSIGEYDAEHWDYHKTVISAQEKHLDDIIVLWTNYKKRMFGDKSSKAKART